MAKNMAKQNKKWLAYFRLLCHVRTCLLQVWFKQRFGSSKLIRKIKVPKYTVPLRMCTCCLPIACLVVHALNELIKLVITTGQ